MITDEVSHTLVKRVRLDSKEHPVIGINAEELSDKFRTALRIPPSANCSAAFSTGYKASRPICRELLIKVYESPMDWNAVREIKFSCLPNGDLDLKTLGLYLGAAGCCQVCLAEFIIFFTRVR